MKDRLALFLFSLILLCGCGHNKSAGQYKVLLPNNAIQPIASGNISKTLSELIVNTSGKPIGYSFSLLNDKNVDIQIAVVIYTIDSREYRYPAWECTVPLQNTKRYIWLGPHDKMNLQNPSRDAFFFDLGLTIERNSDS